MQFWIFFAHDKTKTNVSGFLYASLKKSYERNAITSYKKSKNFSSEKRTFKENYKLKKRNKKVLVAHATKDVQATQGTPKCKYWCDLQI